MLLTALLACLGGTDKPAVEDTAWPFTEVEGAEGGPVCDVSESTLALEEAAPGLGFSAQDVLDAFGGDRAATLVYRDGTETPLSLSVAHDGGDVVFQDRSPAYADADDPCEDRLVVGLALALTTDDGAYTTMIVSGDGHYEPRVATSATTIVAGSRVSVTGTGYAPGATVTVTWADGSGRGATAVTDDTGTFTVELVVLPSARPGARRLVAAAGEGQVAVTDVLVVAAGRSAGPASPTWPGRP